MPAVFLTQSQRDELNNFPSAISLSDLNYYFRLSPKDLEFTRNQKGAVNRLGFALQLGALRYLGFIPRNLEKAALPPGVLDYLARQLKFDPQAYTDYGKRENTRFEHARQVRQLLNFNEVEAEDKPQLAQWLIERALEHDAPLVLLRELIAHLYNLKLVRPGLTTLEAMVVEARQIARLRTFQLLEPIFTPQHKAFLDSLLKRMPAPATNSSTTPPVQTEELPLPKQASEQEQENTEKKKTKHPEKENSRWSRLEWLRRETLASTPQHILTTLAKLEWLRSSGLSEWDSTMQKLSPNRRRLLAGLARRMSTKALAAQPATERYPKLACFAHWCLVELTDHALDLFDSYLAHCYTKARHDLEDFRQETASAANEKVHYFRLIGQVILDEGVTDAAVRQQVFESLPASILQTALIESEQLIRPLNDHYLDFFARYFPSLRQFTPKLLATLDLDWRCNAKNQPLLQAVKLLNQLNTPTANPTPTPKEPEQLELVTLPANAPQSFIDEKWRPYIYRYSPTQTKPALEGTSNTELWVEAEATLKEPGQEQEKIARKKQKSRQKKAKVKVDATGQHLDRKFYELCVLWELRQALRAGNIWVEGSRRYARLEGSLIPKERWHKEKKTLCELFGLSLDGASRLNDKERELHTWAVEVEKMLSISVAKSKSAQERKDKRNTTSKQTERLLETDFNSAEGQGKVWLEEGRLRVVRLKKQELAGSVNQLEMLLGELLPRIDLPELLCEIDHLTGFTKKFQHASTGEGVRETDLSQLYAAILAQATNVGISAMSRMSGYRPNKLSWLGNWYLHDDAIQTATTELVNFHYHQPLAQLWGDGTLSSSDGQRFAVSVKTSNAQALPRYFGYGRGLSYYTSTSDQLSQFAIKVIPPTLREATYALDGLLDNESDLLLYEHTTDTHGYTELMFGLFDLLGFSFAPRIRDLADQQLYRLGQLERKEFSQVRKLLKRTIRQRRLVEEWDELMRLVVSLKLGWVSASLVIGKLQAYPRQNALTQLLQEYGRVCKTIFILRYILEEEFRHRLETQLNKGEHLHLLRDQFFIGFGRQLRKRGLSQQQGQAGLANLVVNAIVVWNTLYMQKGVEYLRGQGLSVGDEDLRHIWPSRWQHLNVYGQYHFPLKEVRARDGLRDLRIPVADELTMDSKLNLQRTLDEELELVGNTSIAELLDLGEEDENAQ